jgi:hypothetical protein
MTTQQLTYTLTAYLLVVGSAPAQIPLRWKLEKGQVFEVERTATQKQTVELKGKEFRQECQSRWRLRFEVTEKDGDHSVVQAHFTKVEHHLRGAGEAELIDPKLAEKMQGSSFRLTVTPSGRIVQLRGYADFLKRAGGADKGRLAALRVTFPETGFTEALSDVFGPLPPKRVAKDGGWQREYTEPIPHFGALRMTASYRNEAPSKGRARIIYTVQAKYEAPSKDEKMAIFRIVNGSVASDQSNGTIVFDQAAGCLVEHERCVLVRGTLTIEAMDRQQAIAFRSENKVSIRVKKQ